MSASQTPERTLRSDTARNPRRRQRQSDGDTLKTSGPRRKRSKISEDIFVAREGDGNGDGIVVVRNERHTEAARVSTGRKASMDLDLAVRGGKRAGTGTLKHRALKGDGATVLTQNLFYSVKLLPSTPKDLRQEGLEYRGVLGAGHHALAITRTQAHIWDYTAHTPVSNARVFDIPFPARDGEPLPFGALVTSGASTDIGLLLVSATTGKIIYYDSIERAASLTLFQDRKTAGVEGTITAFSSSETVLDITSADHAGYVLSLSSGRIIQLTLRDAQGKPRIFTQPLRPGDASGSGSGFFGSIKGYWSGSWKRGVTAVRTRALDQRGQMQALALTEKCELQIWNLDWSGRYEFRSTVDFREVVVQEARSLDTQLRAETLTAMDFVIADKTVSSHGNEVATLGAEQPLSIWLLFKIESFTGPQEYVVAQLTLAGNGVSVERTTKLEGYYHEATAQKPRLLLPKPGHTAMVVFEDSFVLVATTDSGSSADDPNLQLHEASYMEAKPFEDVVSLRREKGLAVLGACAEDSARSGNASTLGFIKGAGLVRISATDPSGDVERQRVPVKSKIEQAVFYGAMQDTNILDFGRKGDYNYSAHEVEEAAIAVSDEILRSATPFVSSNPASIDAHLDFRARALKALVVHVRQNYGELSRRASWQLLWDAERIAAAQQMYKAFELHKEAASKPKRKATVLDELCGQLEEHHGLESLDEVSKEDDLVRRFFVKGLGRIEYVLTHIRGLLETLQHSDAPPEKVVRYVAEASELWDVAMESVFAFRAENGSTYGLDVESGKDGALGSYADLPEFWTSSTDMLKASRKIASLSRDFAKHYFETTTASLELEAHVKQIIILNPELIQLCCSVYAERIAWLNALATPKSTSEASKLQSHYDAERNDQFCALASVGLADKGMQLAEKHRDMRTLTELVSMEMQYYIEELGTSLEEQQRLVILGLMSELTARVTRYFEKFGDEWANAFFDDAFGPEGRAGAMLEEAQRYWPAALKKYLRRTGDGVQRGRLCWVNDVCAESDFEHAGGCLVEAARDGEGRAWGKKVELSMARLSLLAARERDAGGDEEEEGVTGSLPEKLAGTGVERELSIVAVQERLYRHLQNEVRSALDHEAGVELVMQKFGQKSQQYVALHHLLSAGIEKVLDHQALSVEELIDVLTLMETTGSNDEEGLDGQEFLLALQVLSYASDAISQQRFDTLLRLIWKRCYIFDNWDALSKPSTGSKKKGDATMNGNDDSAQGSLQATAAARTFHALHLSQPPIANIAVLEPSVCLGAACRPEDWAHRFPETDLLDPILSDNRLQDEVLMGYVADRRLDERIAECEGLVKDDVEEVMICRAEMAKLEREMDEAEVEEKGNGFKNGGTNGGVKEALL